MGEKLFASEGLISLTRCPAGAEVREGGERSFSSGERLLSPTLPGTGAVGRVGWQRLQELQGS